MNAMIKQSDYNKLSIEKKLKLILQKLEAMNKRLDVLENKGKKNNLNTISEVTTYLSVSKATGC